ncbi:MAG: hydroxychlorobactene glucosyltransferase CruC [Anaerolineae bacterium]
MLSIITIFVAASLAVLWITALSNFIIFPRLRRVECKAAPDSPLPSVSILIPARNEGHVIADTISSLLSQNYPNFELLLLDDNSTDGTSDIATNAAKGDSRLKIIKGMPLPRGWGGKNWACHQLSQKATADLLLFTDADVKWHPQALNALIAYQTRSNADLTSVWSTQLTESWSERLIVPLMALVILGYLPVIMVHFSRLFFFAAANGQVMLFKREAYQAIGGHEAVRAQVVEDVALARKIKQARRRLRVVDGNRLIKCRMYQDWCGVRDGFAKNILAGHGDSLPFLAVSTIFHWLVFIFPLVWLLIGWLAPSPEYPLVPLLLYVAGVALRAATAWFTRQRILPDALLMPLSALLMTRIAAQSVYWKLRYGGPKWKGRTLPTEVKESL